jgi:hypothetical protein
MRTLRTLLLGLTGLALGVLCFWEAREFVLSGIANLPLKRAVTVYARTESPLAFALSVFTLVVVGVIACAGSFVVLRALLRGSTS